MRFTADWRMYTTTPCASRTTFRPGEWCTQAPPPPRLTPSLHASGTFTEDPDEVGGVTTAKGDVLAPTRRPQRHSINTCSWRPQMQMPPTPTHSQRQSVSHDSHHGGTAHPSQVGVHRRFTPSPQTKYPQMQWGTLSHMQHAQSHKSSVKWAASMPTQRRPVLQQTLGLLTRRPPSRPSNTPFWHVQHTFHVHQGE